MVEKNMISEVKENIEKSTVIIRERVSNCDIDSELVDLISETRIAINDITKGKYSALRRAQNEKDEPMRKEYDKILDDIVFGIDDCSCNKKKLLTI